MGRCGVRHHQKQGTRFDTKIRTAAATTENQGEPLHRSCGITAMRHILAGEVCKSTRASTFKVLQQPSWFPLDSLCQETNQRISQHSARLYMYGTQSTSPEQPRTLPDGIPRRPGSGPAWRMAWHQTRKRLAMARDAGNSTHERFQRGWATPTQLRRRASQTDEDLGKGTVGRRNLLRGETYLRRPRLLHGTNP